MCTRGPLWVLPVCLLALTALGCGDGPVAVTGVVKLDGAPLEGATVTLMSTGDDTIRPAVGYSDVNGVFRLTSIKKDDGAYRGEYRVLVTKIQGIEAPPDAQAGDADAVLKHYQSLKSQPRASLLPAVYASFETTPLRCTVQIRGELVFELESGPKKP